MPMWRNWLRRNFKSYNELANAVLRAIDLAMPEIDLSSIPAAPPPQRRTVTPPPPADKP
jgi:4-hydroxyphenylacetate 3-monooxygenase